MFGADRTILQKNIRLDTDLYRIVAVMPPNFHDPGMSARERNIEVWAATSFYGPPMPDHPARNGRNLPTAIARLRPGLTIQAAQTRVDALVASLQKQFPGDYPAQSGFRMRLVPLKDSVVGNVRQTLVLLLGAVGLVFVIGCVNIANLLLARGSTRARELAIRRALGAGQGRLTRQLLTESLLLSIFGGAAGVVILFWVKDFLTKLVPASLPGLNEISINWTVLVFALIASVVSGLIFGLAPALHIGRLDLVHALKQEGRSATRSREQARTRRLLVITEFGLSVVLLIVAGLLLHSFWDLVNAQLGFNPQSVLTVKTRMPYPNDAKVDTYATPAQQTPFFRELIRRCRALEGVDQVAVGDLGSLPLGHDRNNQNPPISMTIDGRDAGGASFVDESIVTPEYFSLMGITLQRGRLFSDFDTDQSEHGAVINEAMAQSYWPNEDPVGKHIKLTRKATDTTIIGVVANARTESLENPRVPEIYSNIYQKGAKHLAIFLRGKLDAAAIADQVREQVQSIDPTLPVFGAEMLSETVSASLAQRRFALEMVALFALTALLLAAIGIYGVISYIVNERTHEIGIRLALGARPTMILQMLLRQGLTLAISGAAVGALCALIVSRLMSSLFYDIKPSDPVTFASVIGLLIAVASLACYLPARRAMRVDAMTALRCE
jgi:putative ABC transport system permease protein